MKSEGLVKNKKIGVLLINLGTPNSPEKKQVRQYLQEFLSDKRVIDIPWIFRILLLYCIILPFRTKKSAKAYKKIWLKEGSPLFVHSKNLVENVQVCLGENYIVELAMRYQHPSINNAIKKLFHHKIEHGVIVPLFPQYSSAANGSALQKVHEEWKNHWNVVPLTTVGAFYEYKNFIQCFVRRIESVLENFHADYLLLSYHGLPERHILKSDCGQKKTCLKENNCCENFSQNAPFCYKAQCLSTTKAIVSQLKAIPHSTSFQSRLGRTKWIDPDTTEVLPQLFQQGFKRLAVVCPAFVADCLETLEEIEIRAREQWLLLGGESLVLVPSLNGGQDWALAVANMVREHTPHA